MTTVTSIPRTRRAVIAGAIGGTVAIAASAMGRVEPVRAGDDGDVVLGGFNSCLATTEIDNTGTGDTLSVFSQAGYGLNVTSYSATKGGIRGYSNNEMTGVFGYSSPHVVLNPPAPPARTGVHGIGDASGVSGRSSSGVGVLGRSDTGDGVSGSSGGTAKSGVYGVSSVAGGYGVFGRNSSTGTTGYIGGPCGTYGHSASGPGAKGESDSDVGVEGYSANGKGVWGESKVNDGVVGKSASGSGVFGASASGSGVYAFSTATAKPAVYGESRSGNTGVLGASGSLPAVAPTKTGVYGYAVQDTAAMGVKGQSTVGRGVQAEATSGFGVRALASTGTGAYVTTTSGTAVYAAATTSGYALRTSGRISLAKASGVATIAAGNTSVLVTPGLDVTTTSFVLLTPKADIGTRRLWYTTDATANTITIRTSSAVTAGLAVGWLLLG